MRHSLSIILVGTVLSILVFCCNGMERENGQRDDLEILKAAASHPDTMFGPRSIERSEVIAWLAPPENGQRDDLEILKAAALHPDTMFGSKTIERSELISLLAPPAEKRQKEADERAKWTVATISSQEKRTRKRYESSNHEIDFYANTDSEQSIIKHAETTANYANAGTLSLSQSPSAEAMNAVLRSPQQHFLVSQEDVDPPRVGPRQPQQMLPAPRKGKGRKNFTPRRAPMHS